MTTFKFNFSGNNEELQHDVTENNDEIKWLETEEVIPTKEQLMNLDDIVTHARMFTYGDIEIGHVLLNKLQVNNNLVNTEYSDLIPAKYEGGLKIWECTYDLIEYLTEHQESISLEKSKVIDLGCGAGILGIYAYLNGALVTFQDYNKEVIEQITIPNVLLNIEDDARETEIKKCKFYSGDWDSLNAHLPDSDLYDVIFTSETIYNQQNYDKLIKFFTQRLDKDGIAYVAAKTYYFGVGGGTRQFEQEIQKSGLLQSEVVWKSTGGIQREILKINHIKS